MALIGLTNDEKIWNYFKNVGMSEYGIAGLIGNLDCESALNPKNLEQIYETKLGFTDDTYVKAVDNGTYLKFVNDCAGFGIAQWTWWTRKQNLLQYAKASGASIGDLEMQVNFLHKELSEKFSGVWEVLMNATSVREASNIVLLQFEQPADQTIKTQDYRCSVGQKYYEKLSNKYLSNDSKNSIAQSTSNFVPMVLPVNGYYKIKKGANIKLSDHFTSSELDCHGSGCCTYTIINEKLIEFLEKIRLHFCKPITITSGYRCVVHNRNIGGAAGSRHSKGDAADIVVAGVAPREVAKYAESIGIKGIGLYETSADGHFVHIDTRDVKSFWYGQACAARSTFGGSANATNSSSSVSTNATTYNKVANANYIQYGDTGEAVRELQEKLIRLGYSCGSAGADGSFGLGTKSAVKAFQIKAGFPNKEQDGIVGEKTADAINAEIKKLASNVSAEYIVTASALNVRSGAGMEFPVVKIVNKNAILTVSKVINSWGFVGNGWVSMQYLRQKG